MLMNIFCLRQLVRPLILLTLFLLIILNKVGAQSMVFRAEPNLEVVGIEDRLIISYHLENFPSLEASPKVDFGPFTLLSNPYVTSSHQRNNINGKITSKVVLTYIYELKPEQIGTFQIPAAEVTVKGKKYSSNSLTIQVVEGSLQPKRSMQPSNPFGNHPSLFDDFEETIRQMREEYAASMERLNSRSRTDYREFTEDKLQQNIFIKQEVDQTKVYQGAPVFVQYKLYTRLPMNVSISKLPDLRGFWNEDFKLPENQEPTLEVVNGKEYQVFLLKKSVLYPQLHGQLQLDPAEAKGAVGVAELYTDQWGGRFVAQKEVEVHIKSQATTLNVMQLPALPGNIKQYNGAVGDIKREISVESSEMDINEPLILKITYSGTGNLALITAPELSIPEGLTYADVESYQNYDLTPLGLSGTVTFEYHIYGDETGNFKILIPEDAAFNLSNQQYESLREEIIDFQITGAFPESEKMQEEKMVFFKKIKGRTPYNSGAYTWVLLTSFLIGISCIPTSAKAQYWKGILMQRWNLKMDHPHKEALRRLKKAEVFMKSEQSTAFYEEISKALLLFISDQYNLPLASLNKDTYKTVLLNQSIPYEQWSNIEQVIGECELNLYAGGYHNAVPLKETYEQAKQAIIVLQQALKK